MGLFGMIRRSLGGGGGVGISMEIPKDFTWKDRVIPVTLTLQGHKTEARHVDELEFFLRDNANTDGDEPRQVSHTWVADEVVELAAGSEVCVTINMPLPYDLEAIEAAKPKLDADAPIGQKILGSLVSGAMTAPEHIREYVIKVSARVEGSRLRASASKKIRYGGAFHAGPTTLTLG